jgi:hypothetical protein
MIKLLLLLSVLAMSLIPLISLDTSDIISTSSTTTDVLMTGMSKSPLGLIWSFNSQYSIIPLRRKLLTTADAITDLTLIRADINALVTSFEAAAI